MIRFADTKERVTYPFVSITSETVAAELSANISGRVVEVVDVDQSFSDAAMAEFESREDSSKAPAPDLSCLSRPDGYLNCEQDEQETMRMARAFRGLKL